MLQRTELLREQETTVYEVVNALQDCNLFVQVGEIYQATKEPTKALESYRKGHAYAKAIDLARTAFPAEVTSLEGSWGDYLTSIHRPDQAVSHYIEAGRMGTALRAAIDAKQWEKAADLLDVVGESNVEPAQFQLLGRYYAAVRAYEKAEKFFVRGGFPLEVINMYIEAGQWVRASEAAKKGAVPPQEAIRLFVEAGRALEKAGRFREAEQLYISTNLVDSGKQLSSKSTKNVFKV